MWKENVSYFVVCKFKNSLKLFKNWIKFSTSDKDLQIICLPVRQADPSTAVSDQKNQLGQYIVGPYRRIPATPTTTVDPVSFHHQP